MNYDLFKYQMKMIKLYKEYREDLKAEIDQLIYTYCGVKGISYDKEFSISNPYGNDEKLVLLAEKLKEPQQALDFTEKAIRELEPIVDGYLEKLPPEIKEVVIQKYWHNKTFEEVGKMVGYSDYGIWMKVKKEVLKL